MPTSDKPGRLAIHDIMVMTNSISALIRDNKTFRLISEQQTGAKYGMVTLDQGLVGWYIKGRIARDTVVNRCIDSQAILGKLQEADAEKEAAAQEK